MLGRVCSFLCETLPSLIPRPFEFPQGRTPREIESLDPGSGLDPEYCRGIEGFDSPRPMKNWEASFVGYPTPNDTSERTCQLLRPKRTPAQMLQDTSKKKEQLDSLSPESEELQWRLECCLLI